VLQKDIVDFVLKVEEISKVGLLYSKDPYAIDNYLELQERAKAFLADKMESPLQGENFFQRDIYPTPNVSVRTVVFNPERTKVLLVQEKLDGGYSLPGGWTELTLSPSQSALKELREEAGIEAELIKLVGVFDRYHKCKTTGIPEYMIVFEGKETNKISAPCQEIIRADYFSLNQLPAWSKKNSPDQMLKVLALAKDGKVSFD
jgi:8-oxo-dGTP diphosphatase